MSSDAGGWGERHLFLPVLVAVSAILLTIGIIRWTVIGAPTVVGGQVTSIGSWSARSGKSRFVWVALSDHFVRADSYAPFTCAVGDRVRLRREMHLWGPQYLLDPADCPKR